MRQREEHEEFVKTREYGKVNLEEELPESDEDDDEDVVGFMLLNLVDKLCCFYVRNRVTGTVTSHSLRILLVTPFRFSRARGLLRPLTRKNVGVSSRTPRRLSPRRFFLWMSSRK